MPGGSPTERLIEAVAELTEVLYRKLQAILVKAVIDKHMTVLSTLADVF